VPWSVNSLALKFLSEVTQDQTFLDKTWKFTSIWRRLQIDQLKRVSKALSLRRGTPEWTFSGKSFLSWIWIDVHDASLANSLVAAAKTAGTPVRPGKHGYQCPTHIRIKVGLPESFEALLTAWESL
jgi:histidinol-phosphate/aromatic aminotransferase/cobyric acid decarboxylase-like protein